MAKEEKYSKDILMPEDTDVPCECSLATLEKFKADNKDPVQFLRSNHVVLFWLDP